MIRFDALRRGIVAAMAIGCMALMGQQGHTAGYDHDPGIAGPGRNEDSGVA